MNESKKIIQIFGAYNICARFTPGFLFVLCIYFLCGFDIKSLESNSVIYIAIFVILSAVCGFISSILAKIIEQIIWGCSKNPLIYYLRIFENDLYEKLSTKHKKDDKAIVTDILHNTRKDNKLFWKNITYGFFRNSTLLSCVLIYFSYSTIYLCRNMAACIILIIMTLAATYYYDNQAVESYKEILINKH